MESSVILNKPVINDIVNRYKDKPGELLGILEEIQELSEFKYLDKNTLDYISETTGIPLSKLYSVVTFYSFFNLKPQGKHTIIVCRGTACHTKGSKVLLDEVGNVLGGKEDFENGEISYTTKDNNITIRTVACFGQCALSPVVSVDGIIHSNVTLDRMRKIIKQIQTEGNNEDNRSN